MISKTECEGTFQQFFSILGCSVTMLQLWLFAIFLTPNLRILGQLACPHSIIRASAKALALQVSLILAACCLVCQSIWKLPAENCHGVTDSVLPGSPDEKEDTLHTCFGYSEFFCFCLWMLQHIQLQRQARHRLHGPLSAYLLMCTGQNEDHDAEGLFYLARLCDLLVRPNMRTLSMTERNILKSILENSHAAFPLDRVILLQELCFFVGVGLSIIIALVGAFTIGFSQVTGLIERIDTMCAMAFLSTWLMQGDLESLLAQAMDEELNA